MPFITSLLSHWILLSIAVAALGLYLFYDFGDNGERRMFAAVVFVATVGGAIYLTVSERINQFNQTINQNRPTQVAPGRPR